MSETPPPEGWRFRPARDIGLAPAARWRSLSREAGLLGTATGAAWRAGVRLYLRAAHRLAITGRENIPAPPFVMVANHASHLDALALMAALPESAARRAHALAAGDLFFARPGAALFSAYALNALPVWRGRSRREELATLRTRLAEDGLAYLLFPEGTRSRSGAMAAFQPGLGMMVAGTAVPVLPCHIGGAHAAWPPDHRLPRPFRPLALSIGQPLTFAETANDRPGWQQVAATAEAAVRELGRGAG